MNTPQDDFKLIGLRLGRKTTNENGLSSKECGALWQRFETENTTARIPGKLSSDIYAVYYDYDSDETGYFSYFIGCKVGLDTAAPVGLQELYIPRQYYHIETAKGKMTACMTEAWKRIWNSDIPRKFGYDYEVYDERSRNWDNAEIDIYLSIRK